MGLEHLQQGFRAGLRQQVVAFAQLYLLLLVVLYKQMKIIILGNMFARCRFVNRIREILTVFALSERCWPDADEDDFSASGKFRSSSDWNWRRFRGWFLTILFGGPDEAVATLPEIFPSVGGRFSFSGLGSALSENCGDNAAVGGLKSFRGGIHSDTRYTSSKGNKIQLDRNGTRSALLYV